MKKRCARLISMGLVMGMFALSAPQVNAADLSTGSAGAKVAAQKAEEVAVYGEDSEMIQGEWIQSGNRWWFRFEDGSYPKDVLMKDEVGHIYAFDKDGWMVTGWYKDKEPFEIEGEVFYNWYYFDASGHMVKGWKQINNVWYYFDETDGWMYFWDGFEIDGKVYYFKKSGAMATGWCYDDYYEEWYYANAAGELLTGWQWIGSEWYYLDTEGYFMYSNGAWAIDEGNGNVQTYLFDESGRMVRGWYKQIWEDGTSDWFYFNADGTPYTGWKAIGKTWYYIDDSLMYSNVIAAIDGANYAFDEKGEMVTGWHFEEYTNSTGGDWWYFDANGKGHNGWVASSGNWYWIDDGFMNVDEYHITDGGKISQFKADGSGIWMGYVK